MFYDNLVIYLETNAPEIGKTFALNCFQPTKP